MLFCEVKISVNTRIALCHSRWYMETVVDNLRTAGISTDAEI
ncbi:MAG: hypothetical protein Q8930_12860 [Bacillota bacterium]|nr:hypothetical protein [Bacillota bacterium]